MRDSFGRFKKGHKTWNKGTKGICKPNSSSFRKGQIPHNKQSIYLTCMECGKEFRVSSSRKRKFCSSECKRNHNTIEVECMICKKKFRVGKHRESTAKCCSIKCANDYFSLSGIYSGENCHFWKGGISPFYDIVRGLREYREWRRKIFKRDNYTCQICGKRGRELNADHYPMSFAEIIDTFKISSLEEAVTCSALYDTNNGRTLCEGCHKDTLSYGKSLVSLRVLKNAI